MKSAVVSIFVLHCIITVMMPSKSAFSQDTLSLRPGPEDGNDASVSDYYPNGNYANDVYIKAFSWTISGYPVVVRSFFSFNLDTLPSGSEIIGAYLDLFGNPYPGQ
jgi:hypothetical protein